jgi:hypothetical protein
MEDIYYAMNPEWEGRPAETGIPRPEYLSQLCTALSRKQVELVMGGRRVGKTTLVKQLAIIGCRRDAGAPRERSQQAMGGDHGGRRQVMGGRRQYI